MHTTGLAMHPGSEDAFSVVLCIRLDKLGTMSLSCPSLQPSNGLEMGKLPRHNPHVY